MGTPDKLKIDDLKLDGKRVLMRVDFNVPITEGRVADDTRIAAALPSIRYALEHGASVVLMSHLGRPKGKVKPELSLEPVAARLEKLLGSPVIFSGDCVGPKTKHLVDELKPGEVLLLENVRFHPEEEAKVELKDGASKEDATRAKAEMLERQERFAKELASFGDLYVNDAFGTAHRAHASTAIVAGFFERSAAGFLMAKEIDYLGKALAEPERPFGAILGGAKVSDKVGVITNLLKRVDWIIIGGAMAYTFYRAKGLPVGKSLVEEAKIDLAKEIIVDTARKKVRILLPVDHVVADDFSADANIELVEEDGIDDGWMALDIGPKSIKLFSEKIVEAKTIIWNGPMGCFEMEPFRAGTFGIARAIAETDCLSIVGGGDSASAVRMSGLSDGMSHISTGGGASLEFLEGKELPGLAALTDAKSEWRKREG